MSINNTSIYVTTAILGGGIYNDYGIISVDESNIYRTTQDSYGGGISNELYGNDFHYYQFQYISNTAIYGGGVDNYHGNLIISTSNLSNNTAHNLWRRSL